ncbi:hypothetical protein D3C74_255960 [compost metagenome]
MKIVERLGEHMGLWSKQLLREFIKENNLVTAQNAFAEIIQEMLVAEMDTHSGYEKHDMKAKLTPNSRNGKSLITGMGEYGEQEIAIPRPPR